MFLNQNIEIQKYYQERYQSRQKFTDGQGPSKERLLRFMVSLGPSSCYQGWSQAFVCFRGPSSKNMCGFFCGGKFKPNGNPNIPVLFVFETVTCSVIQMHWMQHVAQDSLKLVILLIQLPGSWDHLYVPSSLSKMSTSSQAWWRTPVIPALGRQRQADF